MPDKPLEDRRKALENEFFQAESRRQLEKLRADQAESEQLAALQEVSGIREEAVLRGLLEAGVHAESLASLVIVPLVAVAWADGKLDGRERRAILSAAEELGIARHTPNHDLLESWLARRPPPRLLDLWIDYATELGGALDGHDRSVLAHDLIDRAREVARRSGGLLGLGSTSKEEQAVIQRLERAFEGSKNA